MAKSKQPNGNGESPPVSLPGTAVPPGHHYELPPLPQTTAIVPAASQSLPPAEALPAPAPAPRRWPTLGAALAGAILAASAVKKDARNAHHGYRYASADAIIAEARQALAGNGLSLVPLEQSIDRSGHAPDLVRRFVLLHESGESMTIGCVWPIVEERGRPLDKAMAIAATSSLAYTLRDLLQLPRISPSEDLAAQKDGQPASAKSAKQQAQQQIQSAVETRPEKATTEQLDLLSSLRESLWEAGEVKKEDREPMWQSILKRRGVQSARDLTPEQADELAKNLRHQVDCASMQTALEDTPAGAKKGS